MTPGQFKAWRAEMGWSQARAAEEIGVSRETVINYESGVRREDGRPVVIPKYIALACAALTAGIVANH